MYDYGLGNCRTINGFVKAKLAHFQAQEHTFAALFESMFSERENIMYEKSEGYRIITTTYGQSRENILRRAPVLRSSLPGAEQDAVIGLHLDNSLDWLELFWAILAAGFRPLLLNLRLSDACLEQALQDSGAVAVISCTDTFSVPALHPDALLPGEETAEPGTFGSELFVMSSGTSGRVKLCAYSGEEFYYQVLNSFSIIHDSRPMKKHYHGRLKQLTFLPFYHVFGLMAVYIWFAFYSRTFVQLNDMAPQTILNTIRRHKVTHIFAVPLFWETVYTQAIRTIRSRGEATWKKFCKGMELERKLERFPRLAELFSRLAFREVRENLFGDSISFLIAGGSAIRPQVMEFFNAVGYPLADGYGMTEIGITSVELSNDRRLRSSCSVGKPMQYAEYSLAEDGELLARGRVLAKYVIEDGRRIDRAGENEWFHTRDLAECRNGRYYILGRKDDLIIGADGENLNPNLIEAQLELPDAEGVCLIGVKENENTVPVLLVGVNRFLSAARLQQVETAARERLRELKLSGAVARVALVGQPLLKGDEFKLNRRRLTEEYRSGVLPVLRPEDGEDPSQRDALTQQVIACMAAALDRDPDAIGPNADFFLDLGGSSLDYFGMLTRLQDTFPVTFPTDTGSSLHTAQQICDYIKASENHG